VTRLPVTSTSIRSIGFDPDTKTLEIEFPDGQIYEYFGVAENVFIRLTSATSVGSEFNMFIRGRYVCRRIS
jgi:hypothetical protein